MFSFCENQTLVTADRVKEKQLFSYQLKFLRRLWPKALHSKEGTHTHKHCGTDVHTHGGRGWRSVRTTLTCCLWGVWAICLWVHCVYMCACAQLIAWPRGQRWAKDLLFMQLRAWELQRGSTMSWTPYGNVWTTLQLLYVAHFSTKVLLRQSHNKRTTAVIISKWLKLDDFSVLTL